jgi:hypothetical protein
MKLAIHTLRFSKDYFLNYEACAEWLSKHSLENVGYSEVESYYIFNQVAKDKFNEASLQEIKVGSGVVAVVGLLVNEDNSLVGVTDSEVITPTTPTTDDVGDDVETASGKKTKLLSTLTTAFDAVKEFISDTTSEVDSVELSDTKPSVEFRVPIIKKTSKKIVFGEVLVPEKTDSQGHIYSESEVEQAAHYWMKEFQQLGEMHSKMLNGQSTVLESYVAPVTFSLGDRSVKKGTWLLKLYVEDDDLWAKIEGGEYTGFSIQGLADAESLTDGE